MHPDFHAPLTPLTRACLALAAVAATCSLFWGVLAGLTAAPDGEATVAQSLVAPAE